MTVVGREAASNVAELGRHPAGKSSRRGQAALALVPPVGVRGERDGAAGLGSGRHRRRQGSHSLGTMVEVRGGSGLVRFNREEQ
jgi:hypothetical protein